MNTAKTNLLIFIPTYNEINNVETIINKIFELEINSDILFIDDNSPDGTGELLEHLCKKFSRVFIKHRSGKLGIGSAHRDGIIWAYENHYDRLITLDCDATHPPEYIPLFLEMSSKFDLVVGTRHLNILSLADWSFKRKFLTKLGYLLTRFCLDVPYDATGAYRIYNLNTINSKFLNLVRSKGYSFFFESIFILNLNGFSINELSIHLPSRTRDQSKMRYRDILYSFYLLFFIFVARIFFTSKRFIIKK